MGNGTQVRAVYEDGVLRLLTPLNLQEGEEVSVVVLAQPGHEADDDEGQGLRSGRQMTLRERRTYRAEWERKGARHGVPLSHPTKFVPAVKLDNLTSLVGVGGDALADSEALYD